MSTENDTQVDNRSFHSFIAVSSSFDDFPDRLLLIFFHEFEAKIDCLDDLWNVWIEMWINIGFVDFWLPLFVTFFDFKWPWISFSAHLDKLQQMQRTFANQITKITTFFDPLSV